MKQLITKCPQCRRIIQVQPAHENAVLWRLCCTCRTVEHERNDLARRCVLVTLALGALLWWVLH